MTMPRHSRRKASSEDDALALINRIYEAALDISVWPSVLKEIVDFVGNSGTHLWLMDRNTGLVSHTIHVGMPDDMMAEYNGEVIRECPRYVNACKHPERRILFDYQHIVECDIDRNEYYNWLQTRGDNIRYYLGGRLLGKDGSEGFQSLAFRKKEGHCQQEHIGRFEIVLPHVERALQIGQRLGTWSLTAEASLHILDQLTCGVIILDASGRIIVANRIASNCTGPSKPLQVRAERLRGRTAHEEGTLQRLIGECIATAQGTGRAPGGGFAILSEEGTVEAQILVSPLKLRQGILDARPPCAGVFIFDRTPKTAEPERIAAILGLTQAEARVATMLSAELTPAEVASKLGISINTVRTQLKSIYAKTSTRRQSELIALIQPLMLFQNL